MINEEFIEEKIIDLDELAEKKYPYPCPMWYAGDSDGYYKRIKEIDSFRNAFIDGFMACCEQLKKPK